MESAYAMLLCTASPVLEGLQLTSVNLSIQGLRTAAGYAGPETKTAAGRISKRQVADVPRRTRGSASLAPHVCAGPVRFFGETSWLGSYLKL